jgi:hypothetical protein
VQPKAVVGYNTDIPHINLQDLKTPVKWAYAKPVVQVVQDAF